MKPLLIVAMALLVWDVSAQEVRWLVNVSSLRVEGVVEMPAEAAGLPEDGAWQAGDVKAEAHDGTLRWQLTMAPLTTRRVTLANAVEPLVPLKVTRGKDASRYQYDVAGWRFIPGGPEPLLLAGPAEDVTTLEQAGQLYAIFKTGATTWLVRADGSLHADTPRTMTLPAGTQITQPAPMNERLGRYVVRLGEKEYTIFGRKLEMANGQLILPEGGDCHVVPTTAPDGVAARLLDSSILVFAQTPEGFVARHEGHAFTVTDANANGEPDLRGDQWLITSAEAPTMGWKLLTAEADPRKEGACLLISLDANGDGNLDQTEWARPVRRLTDWNGDGAWLRGSLLGGGYLEQDAVYERADGSPDGKLWDTQTFALDLDADGDMDLAVHKDHYNFSEAGRGWAIFDFQDQGGAPRVMVLDPLDQAATSLDKSLAVAIRQEKDRGVWLLGEERQSYPGGYLQSRDGKLESLTITHGPSLYPKIALAAWKPPVITYRDPAGHSFSFVSAFKPTVWGGQALELRDARDGKLDFSDQAPWPKIVESTAAAEFLLPDGHREQVPHGVTPKALYYSPIYAGFHAAGSWSGVDDSGIHFYDEDDDGIMDHYVLRELTNGRQRVRSLRYDIGAKTLKFRDGQQAVSLNKSFTFTRIPLFLGEAFQPPGQPTPKALVQAYGLNERGQLPGTRALPTNWPLTRLRLDAWHANGRLSLTDDPHGMRQLLPLCDRFDFDVDDLVLPMSMEALSKVKILVISDIRRGPTEEELQVLRRWVAEGGRLVICPSRIGEDQRLALNTILTGLHIPIRFGDKAINSLDVPASGMRDSTGLLLSHCETLSVNAWPVTGAQLAMLSLRDQCLVGSQVLAKGKVVLIGLPLLVNAGLEQADNQVLAANFLRWLK